MTHETDDQKGTFVKEVFRQNWEHARHVEIERLLVTNFYIAIVAGFVAYFGREMSSFPVSVSAFLLILTLAAFLVCFRLECEFHQHVLLATLIAEKQGLGASMGKPLNLYATEVVGNWLSTPVFGLMYTAIFSGLVSILVLSLTGSQMASLTALGVLFITLSLALVFIQRKQYAKISDACTSNNRPCDDRDAE